MTLFRLSILALISVMALTACANGSDSQSLEDSFAADPQLEQSSPSPDPTDTAPIAVPEAPELERLPPELPQYDPATWLDTTELEGGDRLRSRWQSDDPPAVIADFYRGRLQEENWQLNSDESDGDEIQLAATGMINDQDWPVTVIIRPRSDAEEADAEGVEANGTDIEVTYPSSPSRLPDAAAEDSEEDSEPSEESDPPEPRTTPQPQAERSSSQTTEFSDLETLDAPLATYVKDVAELGILSPLEGDRFAPEETMTRRNYARWLMRANNRFYENQSAQQLRQSRSSSEPAFQDIPQSDPDFGVIQGLAEAGIIPSSLSGDDTTILFRPDDPLLREDLLRWKVPLDVRRGLPNATFETIQETWGFQDTTRITSEALPVVLADFQNGERSNVRRAFGYTTLLQPQKAVTRAEAASSLWSFGYQGEARSASELNSE